MGANPNAAVHCDGACRLPRSRPSMTSKMVAIDGGRGGVFSLQGSREGLKPPMISKNVYLQYVIQAWISCDTANIYSASVMLIIYLKASE
jgi:hypothetical protein